MCLCLCVRVRKWAQGTTSPQATRVWKRFGVSLITFGFAVDQFGRQGGQHRNSLKVGRTGGSVLELVMSLSLSSGGKFGEQGVGGVLMLRVRPLPSKLLLAGVNEGSCQCLLHRVAPKSCHAVKEAAAALHRPPISIASTTCLRRSSGYVRSFRRWASCTATPM